MIASFHDRQGYEKAYSKRVSAVSSRLSANVSEVPEQVNDAFREVTKHDRARWERGSRCLQRVEISACLLRWLARRQKAGKTGAGSLTEVGREHVLAGGFVDWARRALRCGAFSSQLAAAHPSFATIL